METITNSAVETQKLGREIGSSLKGGEILALVGELGSGKTTFIQGLAASLEITSPVISPTFILMRTYKGKFITYHIDLYRLEQNISEELYNLGVKDVWGKDKNIVVVEWADKSKESFPKQTKWIYFEYLDGDKRKITIKE